MENNFQVIELNQDGLFHIGQQEHKNKPAATAVCKYFGGRDFNVGLNDCFIAIRCVKCEYEIVIHKK